MVAPDDHQTETESVLNLRNHKIKLPNQLQFSIKLSLTCLVISNYAERNLSVHDARISMGSQDGIPNGVEHDESSTYEV